jgi:hypothetical protein
VTKIAEQNAAVITNVDPKNCTVNVHMKDESGRDIDRVFHLTEDAEFVDSNGDVATLDIFRAGDQVLFVEEQGKIRGLNKSSPQTANLTQRKGQTTEKR